MKSIFKFLLVALVTYPLCSLYSQNNSKEIVKAFELRMDGNIEEAQTLLSVIIEKDSTNAMAYFELARMSGDDLMKRNHIEKALIYDPNNLMYRFYKANLQMLEAYKAMKTNNKELITSNLDQCTATLKSILVLKPDCKETLLFLIDIYGTLPEEMGGNLDLAKTYLKELKKVDPLYAAQGELTLKFKDGEVDMVKYWNNFIAKNGDSDESLIKLGKAYLMSNDIAKAKEYFNIVINRDAEQTVLHLDIARAHLYTAMRGGDTHDKSLDQFKESIHVYLNAEGNKPKIIEAWCYGWLGMIENRQGNHKKGERYLKKAESIMPNYPRFTATPKVDKPPHIVAYQYKSYFTPF